MQDISKFLACGLIYATMSLKVSFRNGGFLLSLVLHGAKGTPGTSVLGRGSEISWIPKLPLPVPALRMICVRMCACASPCADRSKPEALIWRACSFPSVGKPPCTGAFPHSQSAALEVPRGTWTMSAAGHRYPVKGFMPENFTLGL